MVNNQIIKGEEKGVKSPALPQTIKEIKANCEDLHYPFLILSDGTQINARAMSLSFIYGSDKNGLKCVGQEWKPNEILNYEKERAKIELFPILIKALKENKTYAKLSLIDKGYYEICKNYNLIKELKSEVLR